MSTTLRSIGIDTAKTLYDLIRGDNSNWLFFLGGESASPEENKNTITDDNSVWQDITFLQKIRDNEVAIVARRVNWSSGNVYYPYDSNGIPETGASGAERNYYAMTEDREVFVCMGANEKNRHDQFGLSTSTIKPTRENQNTILADGYTWRFLYKVDLADKNFLTNTYMPVPDINEYDIVPSSISKKEEAFRRGCGTNVGASGSCWFYYKDDAIDPVTSDTFSKGDLDFCTENIKCTNCFAIAKALNRSYTFNLLGNCTDNLCASTTTIKSGYELALDQQRKTSPNRNLYLQANVYKEAKAKIGQIQSVSIDLSGLSVSDLTTTTKNPVVELSSSSGENAVVQLTTYKSGSSFVIDGIRLVGRGSGYRDASVLSVTNNLENRIRINLDYQDGLFADPRRLLNATRVMVRVGIRTDRLADEFGTNQVTFRRYGIIRDVQTQGQTTNFQAGSDTGSGQVQRFSNVKKVNVTSPSAISFGATPTFRISDFSHDKTKIITQSGEPAFNNLRQDKKTKVKQSSKIVSTKQVGSKVATLELIEASNNVQVGDELVLNTNLTDVFTVSQVTSTPNVTPFTGKLVSSNDTNITATSSTASVEAPPREVFFQYIYSLGKY